MPLHNTPTVPATLAAPVTPSRGALRPIALPAVHIHSGFWGDRQALNSAAIIPHGLSWVDRLGWTDNFTAAGTGAEYSHKGREFADSEIYKLVEAMSWDHARRGAIELDAILDRFITLIAGAQDPDGYLHTLFGRSWQQPRYSNLAWGHELYCFGHLIQAAVAHNRATGNERLLAVAIRLADHVCAVFGPDGLQKVCGHPEVEVALAELSRLTGNVKYLDQASVFIERRGSGTLPLHEFGEAYWQDDIPVRTATVLRGHAVRALYLAAGAVDVAIETGDDELLSALELQWETTVARRTYVTGGMGSHHMDEAFGDDYVLPPDRSYCETCAGVASIMFSWRLLLATGKSRYADLIERSLFNIVATSPAVDGQSFFYANTLHQRNAAGLPAQNDEGVTIRGGSAGRQAWFEVSCCPPNVARTLASLGGLLATSDRSGVQLHQFTNSVITATTDAGEIVVEVVTDYPRTGSVRIAVRTAPPGASLSIRIPAWADGALLSAANGEFEVAPGYATVADITAGDVITLDLPMRLRLIEPDNRIDAIRGTVAWERGPEVFALESIDLPDGWLLEDVLVDTSVAPQFTETMRVVVRRLAREPEAAWPFGTPGGSAGDVGVSVDLVRYHEWAERGASTMRVWMPTLAEWAARTL